MKLSPWLMVLLALTAVLMVWIWWPETTATFVSGPVQVKKSQKRASPAREEVPVVDLFPVSGEVKQMDAEVKVEETREAAPPTAPELPFQVVGSWWDDGQRTLVLSDGVQTWLICQHCHKKDFYAPGALITREWRLTEVAKDFLRFEWLPEKLTRRIALEELAVKPER